MNMFKLDYNKTTEIQRQFVQSLILVVSFALKDKCATTLNLGIKAQNVVYWIKVMVGTDHIMRNNKPFLPVTIEIYDADNLLSCSITQYIDPNGDLELQSMKLYESAILMAQVQLQSEVEVFEVNGLNV